MLCLRIAVNIFRNVLVRANFVEYRNGITEISQYLENFYKSLLSGREIRLESLALL